MKKLDFLDVKIQFNVIDFTEIVLEVCKRMNLNIFDMNARAG